MTTGCWPVRAINVCNRGHKFVGKNPKANKKVLLSSAQAMNHVFSVYVKLMHILQRGVFIGHPTRHFSNAKSEQAVPLLYSLLANNSAMF